MWNLILAAAAAAAPCPDAGISANSADLNRFWGRRAVEIVRAGNAGDRTRLRTMVAPDAQIEIWDGDAGSSSQGPEGVIAMAQRIKARAFAFAVAYPGPISLLRTDCNWNVSVQFDRGEGRGAVIEFGFVDGVLASAKGNHVELVEGAID